MYHKKTFGGEKEQKLFSKSKSKSRICSLSKKNKVKNKKEEISIILTNLQPKIYEFITAFYTKISVRNNLVELKLQQHKNKPQLSEENS